MDSYEATRVVFSWIQSFDPENAAKVMEFLLIQDHGEKEMIRLAFGPETLLQSVVLKARKELGLLPAAASPSPGANTAPFPSPLGRQGSSTRLLGGGPLAMTSPTSWAPPSIFSRSNINVGSAAEELQSSDELVSPSNPAPSPFYGGSGDGADLIEELQLPDQLSFLNDGTAAPAHGLQVGPKRDLFYQDMDGNCRSPGSNGESNAFFPYSIGWGATAGQHRRSCSAADVYLGSDTAGVGWKPCLYYARGYCKNGSSCRFLHGIPDDDAAALAPGYKMDAAIEQQCQELLLRSKSLRQLMASAFPYSPAGSVPASPSGTNKSSNFLLQQQNESQRAMAAATAAALMLGGDESHKFMGRPWMMERSDFGAGMANPGARQIYLTFPADSTFREEDVSNYFSIYGPVQDVRIPYQQKRMFGFVTFVYPETVKLILSKGNPHFVCNARVLVKPYKEKGKVPDKYRKQLQQQCERVDFSCCPTPTGLDSRDPFDFSQLGSRMLYNNSISQEALMKRKLEQQQQAVELQQAIELQNRRFTGLQLLDLKNRNHFNSITASTTSISSPTIAASQSDGGSIIPQEESACQDKNLNQVTAEPLPKYSQELAIKIGDSANNGESCASEKKSKEDTCIRQSPVEHNLPDSPFASPTKASSSFPREDTFSATLSVEENLVSCESSKSSSLISSTLFPATAALDMPSFNACFFQLPRNGIQQRKNSWQDGTPGTTCPILPGQNFTYHFQVKDQIGSFYYFPSLGMQKAAGGYGSLRIHSRLLIPVPFDPPADDYSVLIGDWYTKDHKTLARILDQGRSIALPAGVLINGKPGGSKDEAPQFVMEAGKVYRYRICNVGIKSSLNFRIQGHNMLLVEMDGSHTVQNLYESLDVHVGQCFSVLVTANQAPGDYYMVASTRFLKKEITATGIIRYAGSNTPASAELPKAPSGWAWSFNQWRSFRWNLTASAARPNPQGSYHYGDINITRTIQLSSSKARVGGKYRFALNGVSHVDAETPLKLAEYYGISEKVFKYNLISDVPSESESPILITPNVITVEFRTYVEIIFVNTEKVVQSYHLDGYSFFFVGMGPGKWTPESRKSYNMLDAVSRHAVHVFPKSWSAIMLTFDNAGMWNLRSELWERRYLGQELYISVQSPARSLRDEYNLLDTALLCGAVQELPKPAPYT
ncbi:hypothetical protein Cni_G12601 [Canna indica]|uniref:Uncharacterized protein n=1 Tax=Canna indica TaxID=4628 RepID=A0AAQ3KDT7_9LILI|nr:hypothetical protein Cni_G12601 [Canna indica]